MQVMQLYASYASYAKAKCAKYRQRMLKSPVHLFLQDQVERGSGDEATETLSMIKGLIWPTGYNAEPFLPWIPLLIP